MQQLQVQAFHRPSVDHTSELRIYFRSVLMQRLFSECVSAAMIAKAQEVAGVLGMFCLQHAKQ